MISAFDILGVDSNTSDEAVRKAYLQKIREYPPERFPETFKDVRQAFDAIATQKLRLAYRLFSQNTPSASFLAEKALKTEKPGVRPTKDMFLALLANAVDNHKIKIE